MRRVVVVLAGLILGLAGFAVAAGAVTITVQEQGTGLTEISVLPNTPASLAFDVILDTQGDETFSYTVSIRWDGGATAYLSNVTAAAFLPPGFDYEPVPGITVVQSGAGTAGTGDDYDAAIFTLPPSPPPSGVFTIGTLTVTAMGPPNTSTYIVTTFTVGEAVLDGSGLLKLPVTHVGSSVVFTPEPATAWVLVLGLIGLAINERRRRA